MVKQAPIAVIAGGGDLPGLVIRSAMAQGREVVTIAIKGEADASLSAFNPVELGWGQIGKLFSTLKSKGVRDVVLIGGVQRRPDFTSILGDFGTMWRLPRIIAAVVGGDDHLLVKVAGIFEREGLHVVGAHEVAPELVASPGHVAGPKPSKKALSDMTLAIEAVDALGRLDIGQGAIAVNARVVAVEGAEGTDAMLERVAVLRENGRVRSKGAAGVLVKCSKPQQDLRLDMPGIGPQTIRKAAEAQLQGVCVEAGRVLVAHRDEVERLCDELGVFLYGCTRGEEADT
ncbi:LpxI family protein [Pseudovibrio sp. JE062]|uniref:LpxI family protein n=1 Tax=Pseudovibrio sp. JE062 TaxID=439495 RepID=UPI000186C002|nr:UDP-2,3-diacylglucosamine diphosphatase LpxI [Pseudovibrio sp. JE062]EEA96426.1 phosphatidate cytidyltransferase [Pseudovibrio sp. JE062]